MTFKAEYIIYEKSPVTLMLECRGFIRREFKASSLSVAKQKAKRKFMIDSLDLSVDSYVDEVRVERVVLYDFDGYAYDPE